MPQPKIKEEGWKFRCGYCNIELQIQWKVYIISHSYRCCVRLIWIERDRRAIHMPSLDLWLPIIFKPDNAIFFFCFVLNALYVVLVAWQFIDSAFCLFIAKCSSWWCRCGANDYGINFVHDGLMVCDLVWILHLCAKYLYLIL